MPGHHNKVNAAVALALALSMASSVKAPKPSSNAGSQQADVQIKRTGAAAAVASPATAAGAVPMAEPKAARVAPTDQVSNSSVSNSGMDTASSMHIQAACTVTEQGCVPVAGITTLNLQAAISQLRAPPHRMEVVGRHRGLTWINDSKVTDQHSVHSVFVDMLTASAAYQFLCTLQQSLHSPATCLPPVSVEYHMVGSQYSGHSLAQATNVEATLVGLQGLGDSKAVVLLGGRAKQQQQQQQRDIRQPKQHHNSGQQPAQQASPSLRSGVEGSGAPCRTSAAAPAAPYFGFDRLGVVLSRHRAVVCYGECGPLAAAELASVGVPVAAVVDDLEAAVAKASALALPGRGPVRVDG